MLCSQRMAAHSFFAECHDVAVTSVARIKERVAAIGSVDETIIKNPFRLMMAVEVGEGLDLERALKGPQWELRCVCLRYIARLCCPHSPRAARNTLCAAVRCVR